jgi:hypothetical protein
MTKKTLMATIIITTILFSPVAGMKWVEVAKANFLPPPNNTHITIDFPQNLTYDSRTLNLNFTLQSNGYGWYWYKVDENERIEINVTTVSEQLIDDGSYWYAYNRHTRIANTVLPNLTNGNHRVTVFELGSNMIITASATAYFTIDADDNAPILFVFSNGSVYDKSEILLSFTINEKVSWIGYSLDSASNITCNGNFTIKNILNGIHNVTVYANDTNGNMGKSNNIFFTIDTSTPPSPSPTSTTIPSPSPNLTPKPTPTSTPTVSPSPSPSKSPSISPSSSPTQKATIEPSQTPNNSQTENFTPAVVIVGLATLAVAVGLLVYFKRKKG